MPDSPCKLWLELARVLPQLLSPLLPLIDADEILMMQRRQACGSPASLGAGRERGRGGRRPAAGLDTSLSITVLHSFTALPTHRGSLPRVCQAWGCCVCDIWGRERSEKGGAYATSVPGRVGVRAMQSCQARVANLPDRHGLPSHSLWSPHPAAVERPNGGARVGPTRAPLSPGLWLHTPWPSDSSVLPLSLHPPADSHSLVMTSTEQG